MSAAVESAPMANSTPTEGATAGAGSEQPTSSSQNQEVLASAAEGQTTPKPNVDLTFEAAKVYRWRRLYIGNLAYATTEGELKDFFKDYLVESVSIPTNPRTTRPVGYAFVDLSTPSEAERAITELNGKNVLERKVSIQLARKPEAATEGAGSGGEGTSGNETRRRSSGRGRGRGRGRGGRATRGGRGARKDGTTEGVEGSTEAPAAEPLADATNGTTEKGVDDGSEKPRVPRERKQRGPPEDGVASKTKVMVANLPYDLREDKLMEIFKDYSPSSAKIALRPIPRFMVKKLQARGEPRKGRGFGFVTLASEELQQKACDEMNGKDIEGREIAVKVAIDSPGKEDEDPSAVTEDAGAAEEAAPAEAAEPTAA